VSESQWWSKAVRLAVLRLGEPDDCRVGPHSSRQIDARTLVLALNLVLNAERLEQAALNDLGIEPSVRQSLEAARDRFLKELPGVVQMRDALTHFDEWSRGVGRGPQAKRVKRGDAVRDVARDYWAFRYEAASRAVSLGPYVIDIDVAERAATDLAIAIYVASGAVDQRWLE
jgi:hypothetical protein